MSRCQGRRRPTRQEQFESELKAYGLVPPEALLGRWPTGERLPDLTASRRRSIRMGRRLLDEHHYEDRRRGGLDAHVELAALTDALAVGLGRGRIGEAWLTRLSGVGISGAEEVALMYITAVWCEQNPAISRAVGWGSPAECAGKQRLMQRVFGVEGLVEAVYRVARRLPW